MGNDYRIRLTRARVQALVSAIRRGMPNVMACKATCTPHSSFYSWKKRGIEIQESTDEKGQDALTADEALLLEFVEKLEEAQASFLLHHLENIARASEHTWQASAWLLERTAPSHFSLNGNRMEDVENSRRELDGSGAIPVPALLAAMEGTMRGVRPADGVLPSSWSPFRWTPSQLQLLDSKKRFIGLACGRGSGKTEIAFRRLVIALGSPHECDDSRYFYCAPTNAQALRIAWDRLLDLIPKDFGPQEHRASQFIDTRFGARIYVLGMDVPQRFEGVQWDGGVIDEACDQHPGVFDRTILPALTHRRGWCWRIGVPKRYGPGASEFRRFCEEAQAQEIEERAAFSWPSSDVLAADDLAYAKQYSDPRDYREQFEATWEYAGGGVFWAFDRTLNVRPVTYDRQAKITVGSDFNVDPMAWVLCHRYPNRLEAFDEIWLRNTNTRQTLDTLWSKYKDHAGGWEFVGDASGRSAHTSASDSDYQLLRLDERFRKAAGGCDISYPSANPPVADRFAWTNAMLLNAQGERRLFVAPHCLHLIDDLQARQYKAGTSQPADPPGGDVGHMTDAIGYIVARFFALRVPLESATPRAIISMGTR